MHESEEGFRHVRIKIAFFIGLAALMIVTLLQPRRAEANNPATVKARPRIPGDMIDDFKVDDLTGNRKSMHALIGGKYAMVAFVPAEALQQKNLAAYFKTIRVYIEQLGYEIVTVTTKPRDQDRAELYQRRATSLFIDPDRAAFIAMGLADSNEPGASVISGVFFVGPSGRILSQFTSADNHIPISGDALVLSARVYKQIEEKNRAAGVRTGPTIAPPIEDGPYADSMFDPASSSIDVARSESGTGEPRDKTPKIADTAEATDSFAQPDETVLRLLTVEDVARTNSYWIQGSVGVTAYDARRNTWSPRWSPALQVGRRMSNFGVFFNFALDQTFDLTQEVKRLDVLHFGLGLERVSLYGRARSSLSAGVAVLNSDTDIDSRGKIGWYGELRPIALRWGIGRDGAIELTPLALNVSVPVTRGIPLIQVGYLTVLSYEWAHEAKP